MCDPTVPDSNLYETHETLLGKKQMKKSTRRNFLGTTGVGLAGTALPTAAAAAQPAWAPGGVHHSVDDVMKVALIGCGGRGTGAALNALEADPNTKVTVLADIFPDRIGPCLESIKKGMEETPDRVDVPEERQFSGFDAYKQVMATDVDVVLLCTTPHFRPVQLKAAIEAGKHVFCEKPVAVDGPGIRSVLETCRLAKEKSLAVVSGLCWRYDTKVNEVIKRIKDGAIGDIVAIEEDYLTSPLWHRGRNPEWSEMEYQIRNWLYFTWLSGDHIAEQHIHSLDKALWLNDDQPPLKCFGLGGRQVRTGEKWGNVYDHFACTFEWESGVKAFSFTRQMPNCMNNTDDYVLGTKGKAQILRGTIENDQDSWRFRGRTRSMYVLEHIAMFESIRRGEPINNGEYMSYSTLMAVMGREACYTGKEVTRDDILNSDVVLGPTEYSWGDVAVEHNKVRMPG